MSSLLGTMSIALGSLEAQQAGLEATTNNIANLNTPGYTRQRPILEEADPVIQNGMALGNGVDLKGIQSLRDSILELQIGDETQQQGKSQALVNAMSQVQTLFPDDTTGIGQQISTFFQSLNSLSTNPSDTTLRQSVLSAANGVAAAFNNAAQQLSSVSGGIDLNVQQAVGQVNQITQQIADINSKLNQVGGTSQDYGSFSRPARQLGAAAFRFDRRIGDERRIVADPDHQARNAVGGGWQEFCADDRARYRQRNATCLLAGRQRYHRANFRRAVRRPGAGARSGAGLGANSVGLAGQRIFAGLELPPRRKASICTAMPAATCSPRSAEPARPPA